MIFAKEACSFSKRRRTVGLLVKRSVVACTTQIISESKRRNTGNLPKTAEDPFVKQEFLELAAVCEEVTNEIDDRRASG